MNTNHKRAIVSIGLLASLTLTAACGSDDDARQSASTELRSVSVVLDWSVNTNHTGLYLAQAEGYFADRGLDVHLIEPGDTSGLQLLAAGKADFAVSVSESLVPARIEGAPVVSVAAIIQQNTSSLISLADRGIRTPADLAGHSYGTYGSDLEAALVGKLAECAGVPSDAVELIPLTGVDFRIGLTEDMFDMAWVYDGWDTIKLRDLDGLDVNTIAFADYTDCIPNWYTPILATSEQTLADDPQLVQDFLAAAAEGYALAMSEPSVGVDALMDAAPELDRALIEESATYLSTRYAHDPVSWGTQEATVWNEFIDFLVANGLAPDDFDTDAAWTDEPLATALGR
jgi:ABC-type nitrate/sulfonate/bicarbonate transport system substrate-binding protein